MSERKWVWSAEIPTETGWYWFRAFKCGRLREQKKCIFVEMHPSLGGMMRDGRLPTDMDAWPGEWCGPIPEPQTAVREAEFGAPETLLSNTRCPMCKQQGKNHGSMYECTNYECRVADYYALMPAD